MILKHGSGLTSFKIECKLFIHFVGKHGIKSVLELVGVKVFVRESDQAWRPVVRKVNKYFIALS